MVRSRIAPTPSGYLHIGNLCSFVRTWKAVRHRKGHLLLRIDDIDNERARPEYLQDIFNWLQVLKLDVDEGPRNVDEFQKSWSQLLRLPLYENTLQKLVSTGKVYACNCSRKKIAALSNDGRYHGECRNKNIPLDAEGIVWRLAVEASCITAWEDELLGHCGYSPAGLMGDFVIRRKNRLPSYQVASLTDDLHFNINYIVRGEDLLASTAAQLYMAGLLKAESFLSATFCHHPLIKNEEGLKLSKSAGDKAPIPTEASKAQIVQLLKSCCDVQDIEKFN